MYKLSTITDHFVVQVEKSVGYVSVCMSVRTITYEQNDCGARYLA